jgi:hypothetical protein
MLSFVVVPDWDSDILFLDWVVYVSVELQGQGVEEMYLMMQQTFLTKQKIGSGGYSVLEDDMLVRGICTVSWSLEIIVGCPIGGEQVIAAYMLSSEV